MSTPPSPRDDLSRVNGPDKIRAERQTIDSCDISGRKKHSHRALEMVKMYVSCKNKAWQDSGVINILTYSRRDQYPYIFETANVIQKNFVR